MERSEGQITPRKAPPESHLGTVTSLMDNNALLGALAASAYARVTSQRNVFILPEFAP